MGEKLATISKAYLSLFCCDRTLGPNQAGVIPFGAVSSSGYGDGGYVCGYHTNEDKKVDMAFISFI